MLYPLIEDHQSTEGSLRTLDKAEIPWSLSNDLVILQQLLEEFGVFLYSNTGTGTEGKYGDLEEGSVNYFTSKHVPSDTQVSSDVKRLSVVILDLHKVNPSVLILQ